MGSFDFLNGKPKPKSGPQSMQEPQGSSGRVAAERLAKL